MRLYTSSSFPEEPQHFVSDQFVASVIEMDAIGGENVFIAILFVVESEVRDECLPKIAEADTLAGRDFAADFTIHFEHRVLRIGTVVLLSNHSWCAQDHLRT